MKPKIVTMCGSSRYCDVMAVCAWIIERDELAITFGLHLLPGWYGGSKDHIAEHESCANEMDNLHLRKIDLSDEIFVVNVDGYIGESTAREIKYAEKIGLNVRYFGKDIIGQQCYEYIKSAQLKAESAEKSDNTEMPPLSKNTVKGDCSQ